MQKAKIAISLEKSLLGTLESRIDGSIIRSRSQAIEYFLRKGLQDTSINTAVLLLKGEHQKFSLKNIKNRSLIKAQIDFFYKHGIRNLYIVSQHTNFINNLLHEISDASINAELINANAKGNALALASIKDKIGANFIVMSGDTYNDFDMMRMVKKHIEADKLATMGLMTREKPTSYGTAVLDGDLIVDFKEKPKHYSTNIVNAGIYILKPEIFEMFNEAITLETDLFPKLAKIKQLVGFFTYGEYKHFGK